MGNTTQALQAVDGALRAVEEISNRTWISEVFHLKGRILASIAPGREPDAEACFLEALRVARMQQAKSLELRAAVSLARLRRDQDRRTEARELLAPIYDWFTEGFDTADLKTPGRYSTR